MKNKTKSNRKVSRSKIWLNIWKKKGIKLAEQCQRTKELASQT